MEGNSLEMSEQQEVAEPGPGVRKVELAISTALRAGVITSVAIIAVGTLISYLHHPGYLYDKAEMQRLVKPGAAFPHTLGDVVAGVKQGKGQAIIAVGLLVLLITPVVRVAISVLAFLFERDRAFTLITVIVLGLLLLSFVLGRVE
jgi:uncharacterized membrane protein